MQPLTIECEFVKLLSLRVDVFGWESDASEVCAKKLEMISYITDEISSKRQPNMESLRERKGTLIIF